MTQTQSSLHTIAAQRLQAKALLEELLSAHRTVIAESSKGAAGVSNGVSVATRDLFKRVTGHSSIENAIEATRRAIEAYERIQTRADSSKNPSGFPSMSIPVVPVIRVTSTGVPSIL
jgi:hypothetical protein